MVNRPTEKELSNKIALAISIMATGAKFYFANDQASMAEILSEGHSIDEIENDILVCLKEIKSSDYAGGRPPMKSYEKKIKGSDLFAFAWESIHMGKKMYLKFVLKNESFFYVSFHQDRTESL